jgi:opacity protein-like surface antigen
VGGITSPERHGTRSATSECIRSPRHISASHWNARRRLPYEIAAQETIMNTRTLIVAGMATLLTAAPLAAQDQTVGIHVDGRGYLTGSGGFATSLDNTAGDMRIEGGVRVAPHLHLFGDFGGFTNLQADLQPTVDAAVAGFEANQGLAVTAAGRLPATYVTTGARFDVPTHSRVLPYVLGGVGVAHLMPSPQFTFASGTMPDGSTPVVGTDVTSALTTSGTFTAPASSNAFMFSVGGGVEIAVAGHWIADTSYRYSRIAADTTLSASPLTTNGMAFGFGYRF